MTPAHEWGTDGPVVMHVDMDAFYVGVELRRNPELRGRPMMVGGASRGVVLSASYEARTFGVHGGMPTTRARRLCPQIVAVPPDFDAYQATSQGVLAILDTFSDIVEVASIDEAFLDVRGSLRRIGRPATIAELVRAKVADEQGITCSVGIGPTKFVAKLASNEAKPDGMLEVPPDRVVEFIHPLPVEKMWGVGEATATALHRLGLSTVSDLAHTPTATLHRAFGPHTGGLLSGLAWGRDSRPVVDRPRERSMGSEQTFGRDTDDPEVVLTELLRMADRTAARMRGAQLLGRTVVLVLRFSDFTSITRSATLRGPTDVTTDIHAAVVDLWHRLGLQRARIRKVGVRMEGLIDRADAEQQPQLDEPEFGWRQADAAIDAAVGRFGPAAVQRASLVNRGR